MKFEHKLFGKQAVPVESTEHTLEKRLIQALEMHEKESTTGDAALDELISDYVGILAFNKVAGVLADGAAIERDKKLILDYLKEHPRLAA
jgi:hypothetical protein